MRSILIHVLMFFILLTVVSLWGFYWAIRPIKVATALRPSDFHVRYENISFRTSDHILIKGWFIPSDKPNAKTIIILHGYPADKNNVLPSRLFLHKNYNLLFFDFRYFGESEGAYTTVGKNEVLDLLAAIDYLHRRGINEVGVWGFSLGGSVALMAASQSTSIKAVIAESSYARLDWMVQEYYKIPLLKYPLALLTRYWAWLILNNDTNAVVPAAAAKTLKIPVLLIHSKQDKVIPFRHALLLEQALRHDPKLKIIYLDNAEHGEFFENYQQIISDFLNEAMKTKPR